MKIDHNKQSWPKNEIPIYIEPVCFIIAYFILFLVDFFEISLFVVIFQSPGGAHYSTFI